MAAGAVIGGLESVSGGGVSSLRPSGSDEWVIHNIYFEDDVDLQFFDGTNVLTFDVAKAGPLAITNLTFHCTNSRYIRVKNVAVGAQLIGFDGVQTA